MALAVGLLAVNAAWATDVFNMGGARNPTTGVWTGTASLEFVPVGNAGNSRGYGYGAVGYNYNIGKYDVTAAQYTAFLNAVATSSDPYSLYNSYMEPGQFAACGIARVFNAGRYSYSVDVQHQNYPVNVVTWGDAARFCNWLTNGQPTGTEGNGTTETGLYTLNGATGALLAITRNSGNGYAIPTEDEWCKAAYYDPTLNNGAGGYWLYPTKSNTLPSNVLLAGGTNNANYYAGAYPNGSYTDPINYLTPVGAFAGSPSAYGTFDQGGDVYQWDELKINNYRGMRGGSFYHSSSYDLRPYEPAASNPASYNTLVGLRVVNLSVPEPTSLSLLTMGVIGLLTRRRKST